MPQEVSVIDAPRTAGLLNLWHRALDRHRDRTAVRHADWSATYAEIDAAADGVAALLRACPIAGEAVLIDLPRDPRWLPTLLGVWRAGAVAVPLPPVGALRRQLAERTAAKWRIVATPDGRLSGIAAVPVPAGQQQWAPSLSARHAYVMATSGSTGEPKLTAVTHATSAAVLTSLHASVPFVEGESALHTAAFTFSSSIRQLLLPLSHGAGVVILAQPGRFDPEHLLAAADDARVTSMDLTPSQLTAVVQWLEHGTEHRLAHLRRLLVASEVFTPELLTRWTRVVTVDHNVFHLYGQTELGGAVSALAVSGPEAPHEESLLRRRDDGLLPLARPRAPFRALFDDSAGASAELLIAGLDPSDGYLAPTGLDRSRYEHQRDGREHLYRTGDQFTRTDAQTMTFAGRSDTEIKILGIRVDTLHMEQQVTALPGVTHAAAVTVTNPAGSARLCMVYTSSRTDLNDLVARTATQSAGPGLPAVTAQRIDAMPMTASGKIDRAAARAAVVAHPAETADPITTLWTAAVGATAADEHQDFFASGGNSLSMLNLLGAVQGAYGVRILPAEFHRQPTLAALRSLLSATPATSNAPSATQPHPCTQSTNAKPTKRNGIRLSAGSPQHQMWIAEQLGSAEHLSAYWLPVDIHIPGLLDVDRLQLTLRQLAAAHDILRAGFRADGAALLIITDAVDADSLVVHQDPIAPGANRVMLQNQLGPMTSGAPLIRLGIASACGQTTVRLRLHHSVVDRRSITELLKQIALGYTTGQIHSGPSYWQWYENQHPSDDDRETARAYWQDLLPGPPGQTAPPGPPQIARHTLTVGQHRSAAPLTTSHSTWLWAYNRALALCGLQQPNLIGVDVDLRGNGEGDIVGPCINTLPVVLTGDDPTPHTAMRDLLGMLAHRSLALGDVLAPGLRPTGDPRQPYFRHHLIHQPSPYPPLRFGEYDAAYLRTPPGIAMNTTMLFARDTGSGTLLELAYDARMITSVMAQTLLRTVAHTMNLHEKQVP
ncbi:AMP-binding protein [Streptomyces lunaelactis]|uniref:AMP-binding protein n=1 Tax=Streptomyces lunaelactis TaxID=1535768 RepID=UPI002814AABE|nr:AMP-binding protein [Streptomyces lunaelactis]